MARLTERNYMGACLKLDCPKNDSEARRQFMEKFREACNKLADFEDEAEKRERGCEYCNGVRNKPGYVTYNLADADVPHIDVRLSGIHHLHIHCNYCPMCGRKLRR